MGRPPSASAASARRFVAGAGLALAMSAATGCQSTSDGLPILTDAHEIVTAAASSSAALSTVHVEIDLKGVNTERGVQQEIRFLMAADIDVQGRNIVGRTQTTQPGAAARVETSEFILLEGTIFTKDSSAPNWSVNNDPGNGDHLPTNAAYVGLIEKAIADGSATLELADAVSCGEATCYHVTAELDAPVTWVLFGAPLAGQPTEGGIAQQPEMQMTPATLDIYIDQKTRLLVRLNGSFAIERTGITFSMTFSNHDLPIRITAPPPQLLQNPNGNGVPPPAEAAPSAAPP